MDTPNYPRSLVAKLRNIHALAAGSCDPEFSRALLEAADEIERLCEALKEKTAAQRGSDQ